MTPEKKFIRYVRNTRPKSVEDIRDWHPRFLGKGAYRETFLVRTGARKKFLKLVIKFPLHNLRAENIYHAGREAKAVRRMHRDPKLLALKRYAPTILHFDRGRGVTIMPLYKPIRYNQHFSGFTNTFEAMLADLLPEMRYEFDNGSRNFGYDEKGCYVVLDAGLIGETK